MLVPVLARSGLDRAEPPADRLFGPRGLSSLLLVLLPVFAGVPGAERLFTITCLVVLLSVVIHGGGIALYLRRHGGAAAGAPTPGAGPRPAARPSGHPLAATAGAPAAVPPAPAADPPGRKPPARRDQRAGEDHHPGVPRRCSRSASRSSWPTCAPSGATATTPTSASGAIRLPPDDAVRLARERRLDQHATLVLYCA